MLCMALLTVSCSKAPEAALIPSDASVVFNVKVSSLWQKGELDKADNIGLLKMLRQEVRNESAEIGKILDAVFENPSSCGLDLKHDVVSFITEGSRVTFAAIVKDQNQFGDVLETLCDETGADVSRRDGDFHMMTIDEYIVIVWDKNKAYMVLDDDGDMSPRLASEMMEMKKEETMASNKQFAEYWEKRDDCGMWIAFADVMDMLGNNTLGMAASSSMTDLFRESSFSFGLSFEKGAIVANAAYYGPVSKSMKKMQSKTFNSDLLGYLPEETLATFAVAMDFDGLWEYMKEMDLDDEIAEAYDEEIIDGVTLRKLTESLDGSFVLTLSGLDIVNDEIKPQFSIVADINKQSLFKRILTDTELPMTNGYYVLDDDFISEISPIYIALNDNAIVITTSEPTAKRVVQGDKSSNGCNAIAKQLKGKTAYFYADLQIDHYPSVLREMLPRDAVTLMRQYIKGVEAFNDGFDKGHMAILLNNDKQNSLAFTIRFVDDNLMTFSSLGDELDRPSYYEPDFDIDVMEEPAEMEEDYDWAYDY